MRKKKYSHHVGVVLSEAMYEELVKITDEKEIGISEYVREIVAQNLKSLGENGNGQSKRSAGNR